MGRDFHFLRFYKKSNLWSGLYGEMLHSTKTFVFIGSFRPPQEHTHFFVRLTFMETMSFKMLYKKRCSQNCRKIHRRTPVPKFLFLLKLQAAACNFIKKETLAQVFSCEFCQIFKNTFVTEHLSATASAFTCPQERNHFF